MSLVTIPMMRRAASPFSSLKLDFTSNLLDGRINFSRTTNATVTRSDGTIGYAPHNLLAYSEQFDNAAWQKIAVTVLSNSELAPNNTTTADLVIPTAVSAGHFLYNTTATVTNGCFSICAKTGGYTWLRVVVVGVGTAWFNTSTGAIGTVNAGLTAFVSPEANGFYRFSLSFTATVSRIDVAIDPANGSAVAWTGDGTNGIYFWGAQLEVGASPTAYNSTTVKNLLGYSELFDNAAWTKSNSFVQTNLLTYSEAFDNAAWGKSNATVTANDTLAPNGYQTADKLVENTATGTHFIQLISTVTASSTYTFSFYVKAAERTYCEVLLAQSTSPFTNHLAARINIATGEIVSNATGTIYVTSVGDGWLRVFGSTLTSSTGEICRIGISQESSGSYTGDGTSGIYIWGAQLVQGSVAGDYRRTDAAALPVYYPNHNGVVCAEKLVASTANNFHLLTSSTTTLATGTPYTASIYAKKGEYEFLQITFSSAAIALKANFNLTTGVVGTVDSGITATITAVGNGYYRCSASGVSGAAGAYSAVFGIITSATAARFQTFAGDDTSGIYIFGAQLSDSASLDPYVLNAGVAPTAAAYYDARFDYDHVTLEVKGLLIEEQRTNIVLNSDAPTFGTAGITLTKPIISNPSGTSVVSALTTTASTGTHVFFPANFTVTSGTTQSFSIYAKSNGYDFVALSLHNGSITAGNETLVAFNLNTGVVGNFYNTAPASSSITPMGNGWYRCSVSWTNTTTVLSVAVWVMNADTSPRSGYTADGTSGIYIWGAQLEAGAFATSYIPTAASQVTRTADVPTIQGSNFYSWINQNAGSLFSNSSTMSGVLAPVVASINLNSSSANRIQIGRTNIASTAIRVFVIENNNTSVNGLTIGTSSANQYAKTIFGYTYNDFIGAANGSLTSADISGNLPIVNKLDIGLGDGAYLNGHIKSISYFPTRLSNDVLKGLTA